MALKQLNYYHNASTLGELEPGDLIEFPRDNYSHWAVYYGGEKVIHISGVGNGHVQSNSGHSFTISGVHFDKAEVRIDNFWDVVEGCRAKKNNSKDTRWSALSPQEILKRARSFLGRVKYNLITANCEHFAKWCRYDKWISDQAINGLLVGGAVVVGTAGLIFTGLALARYANKQNNSRKTQEK